MTLGTGITLIVIGLIFLLGVVEVDIPYIDEYALGVLLTLAGIAAIVLLLTWGRSHGTTYVQRSGGTRVVERRVVRDDDPML